MKKKSRCRICGRKTKKAPQIYRPYHCSGECYDKERGN